MEENFRRGESSGESFRGRIFGGELSGENLRGRIFVGEKHRRTPLATCNSENIK
jgi:hypothetical protein